MKATTVGALIDMLQRHYKWDETLLVDILTVSDYEQACEGSPIPWERGAYILEQNADWIHPDIHNWMAQTIGEEEEK
jgi:hypothetical protein